MKINTGIAVKYGHTSYVLQHNFHRDSRFHRTMCVGFAGLIHYESHAVTYAVRHLEVYRIRDCAINLCFRSFPILTKVLRTVNYTQTNKRDFERNIEAQKKKKKKHTSKNQNFKQINKRSYISETKCIKECNERSKQANASDLGKILKSLWVNHIL